MEREKETTARIVLFKELNILNSYTLECTFFGSEMLKRPVKKGIGGTVNGLSNIVNLNYNIGEGREDIHITTLDLIEVGKDFCKGINYARETKHLVKAWFPINKRPVSSSKKSSN